MASNCHIRGPQRRQRWASIRNKKAWSWHQDGYEKTEQYGEDATNVAKSKNIWESREDEDGPTEKARVPALGFNMDTQRQQNMVKMAPTWQLVETLRAP